MNDGKDWDARFEGEYTVDLPYDFSIIQDRTENVQIMGCANGNLTYEGKYITSALGVSQGKALVVLKKQKGTKATLTATTDGLSGVTISL